MRILVLILALPVMLSLTTSDTNPTPTSETYNLANSTNLAKPHCESRCGDLIVPYPFGIGINSGCSINPEFDIYCNTSADPPKASLSEEDSGWIKGISDSTLRTSNVVSMTCYYPDGTNFSTDISFSISNTPFTFSQVNKFTVLGCDDYAWLTSKKKSRDVSTGCLVYCDDIYSQDTLSDECAGNGCCQSPIPKDITSYTTELHALKGDETSSSQRCTYAFIGEENAYKYDSKMDFSDDGTSFHDMIESNVSVVLDWAIGKLSCEDAKETEDYACQSNSICVNSARESGGYRCICNGGYEGNPYLPPGCQDIDECKDSEKFPCDGRHGTCKNTPGNYTCTCKKGYSGDAKSEDGCQRDKPSQRLLFISLGNPISITF